MSALLVREARSCGVVIRAGRSSLTQWRATGRLIVAAGGYLRALLSAIFSKRAVRLPE